MCKGDIESCIENELVQFREYWELSKPQFDALNVYKILECIINT